MTAPITLASLEEPTLTELRHRYDGTTDAETRTRYQMLLLSQRGQTSSQIAQTVMRSQDTVVRVLKRLDAGGYDTCVPVNEDPEVTETPLLDFAAGYVLRSMHEFPKAGSKAPWKVLMSYPYDMLKLRLDKVDDGVLRFSAGQSAGEPVAAVSGTAVTAGR